MADPSRRNYLEIIRERGDALSWPISNGFLQELIEVATRLRNRKIATISQIPRRRPNFSSESEICDQKQHT